MSGDHPDDGVTIEVVPDNPNCLHCVVCAVQAQAFADKPIDKNIACLIEVIADWVGSSGGDRQMELFQAAERMLMEVRNEVLRGTYKRGIAPKSAAGSDSKH